jgi:hypothetical protein
MIKDEHITDVVTFSIGSIKDEFVLKYGVVFNDVFAHTAKEFMVEATIALDKASDSQYNKCIVISNVKNR